VQIGLSSWHWINGISLRRPKSKSNSYIGVKRNLDPKRGGKEGELVGTCTSFKCIPKGVVGSGGQRGKLDPVHVL
jgi:hypothetical protein